MPEFEKIKGLEQFPNITRKLNSAEMLLEMDPDSAASSMRTAMEMMLKDLCRKYTGNEGADNSERINTLEEKSVISPGLKDRLHDLRKSGNAALHEGWQIETYEAEEWYQALLAFAEIYAAEADFESAVNRGIRLDSGRAVVLLDGQITALGDMSQEERTWLVRDTARRLKEFVNTWQYRQKHASPADLEPQREWLGEDTVHYIYRKERFEIPHQVQEYFALYGRSGLQTMLSAVDASYEGFSCRPVMFRPFTEERLKYTDTVQIPPAVGTWDETQTSHWDEEAMLEYVEDILLQISWIREPSYLLNDGFTGGDGSGRQPMFLLMNEFDLVLPDDFTALKLPEELRVLLIYFPRLRRVTWQGTVWNMQEIMKEDMKRYLASGLLKNGNLVMKIPSGKRTDGDAYTALPQSLTETCPDLVYYLFTLRMQLWRLPDEEKNAILSAPSAYPFDAADPQVQEYVRAIEGEPVQWLLHESRYPDGLDKGVSYQIASIRGLGDFQIRRKYLFGIRKEYDNFVILPDWVFDGALAMHTDVESFLNAVLKICPELLDVEQALQEAPVLKHEYRFCPHCGHELMPGSVFCSECGKKLVQ